MKTFLSCLLSYLILLQGCAGTRPLRVNEIPRGTCVSDMRQAYASYEKATRETSQPCELLNLGVLAYEAGDYAKAIEYLTHAETFTHERTSLFEKGMLHYYRGLAEWALNDSAAVRTEGEAIRYHLPVTESGFLRWCDNALSSSVEVVPDSGQIIVICEAGLMPPLEGQTATIPVLYCDLPYVQSDTGRKLLSGTLYDRWGSGAVPVEAEAGYVKADLRRYRYPGGRMTEVTSTEAGCDSGSVVPMELAVNVFQTKLDELDQSQRELLAMVPVHMNQEPAASYVELSTDEMVYDGDRAKSVDRPQTKREGRRETPKPEKSQKSEKEKKKDNKEEKKKEDDKQSQESNQASDDSDDGGGNIIGAILGGILAAMFVGLVSAMINSGSSGSQEREEGMSSKPSWEMLPVKVFTATVRVAPGPHDMRLLLRDDHGNIIRRHDFGSVSVQPGGTVILRMRCAE